MVFDKEPCMKVGGRTETMRHKGVGNIDGTLTNSGRQLPLMAVFQREA